MKLSYIHYGEGKTLIFLHGYLENKFLWKELMFALSNYQTISIDLPGCGESPPQENQTIDSMALAVKETLDSLHVSEAVIIGHSMGGYVALSFAEQFSSVLKGLILINSHPFADTDEKKQSRLQEIELIKQGKKTLLLKTFLPKLYAPDFNDAEAIENSRIMAELTCPQGMIACLNAMAERKDRSFLLHSLPFPLLWIYGKHDQLFNCELAEKFSTQNQRLIKMLLPNAGHMGMIEEKENVIKAIKQFLLLCY
ncbi:MAG: alpha/beta hydrolase [Bacteroidales bacterium]|nr:alpha/beta hydrolase [Bacteroidales bacterium]